MSTRRKFLRDLAFVATLPALLGNLSPSCPSFEKPGLPIYLTHCHNWLNASLWNALLVGQISFDDLPDMQLDHYDSHSDIGPMAFTPDDSRLYARREEEIIVKGAKETLDQELVKVSSLFDITNHNTFGIYQGLFSKFNWFLPSWHPNLVDEDPIVNQDRWVCSFWGTLKPLESELEGGVPFSFSQSPVLNVPSQVSNRVVTIDLDFFSLYSYLIATNKIVQAGYKLALTVDKASNRPDRRFASAFRHPLSDEDFANRDSLMMEFVERNFDGDVPPNMVHICESPLYCPREHGPALMHSLVSALTTKYSTSDVYVVDLRPSEEVWDRRFLDVAGI
ncbi:hypothetical protein HOC80_04470 [archaeon]|jgi:hypothetical protein|nr:hypothetical protein [archaeon]MBT4417328.1 hypothetical protein [archaeon]